MDLPSGDQEGMEFATPVAWVKEYRALPPNDRDLRSWTPNRIGDPVIHRRPAWRDCDRCRCAVSAMLVRAVVIHHVDFFRSTPIRNKGNLRSGDAAPETELSPECGPRSCARRGVRFRLHHWNQESYSRMESCCAPRSRSLPVAVNRSAVHGQAAVCDVLRADPGRRPVFSLDIARDGKNSRRVEAPAGKLDIPREIEIRPECFIEDFREFVGLVSGRRRTKLRQSQLYNRRALCGDANVVNSDLACASKTATHSKTTSAPTFELASVFKVEPHIDTGSGISWR